MQRAAKIGVVRTNEHLHAAALHFLDETAMVLVHELSSFNGRRIRWSWRPRRRIRVLFQGRREILDDLRSGCRYSAASCPEHGWVDERAVLDEFRKEGFAFLLAVRAGERFHVVERQESAHRPLAWAVQVPLLLHHLGFLGGTAREHTVVVLQAPLPGVGSLRGSYRNGHVASQRYALPLCLLG